MRDGLGNGGAGGRGGISGDRSGRALWMFFLRLIPVIDDSAPLSLCVGGLVNYSLIPLSVYFISGPTAPVRSTDVHVQPHGDAR